MSSKALVAGLATGAAVLAGLLYVLTRPAPVKAGAGKSTVAGGEGVQESGGSSGEKPVLSKETMIKIFEKITSMMQVVVMNLADHEQKVRQAAAQRGKQVTNEEMEQYLMSQFKLAMGEVEQTVYMEFKTNEEQVRCATKHYEEDPEFARTLNQLKALFKAMTGQPPESTVPVPDHVTMEKVLTVMSETMQGINEVLEKLHQELIDEGLQPESNEYKEKLQSEYLRRVQERRTEIQGKHDVQEDVLHAAVLKYQADPGFQQQMMALSTDHRKRLEKLGFPSQ